MTNEEKTMLLIEEVCSDEFGEIIPDQNWTPCNLTCRQVRKKIEYACINIAQWKDEQIKQIQEREIKACNDYIEKHPDNKLMLKYHLGKVALCDELLGADSRDKINMAFATMD
jgi:hypothetical protein